MLCQAGCIYAIGKTYLQMLCQAVSLCMLCQAVSMLLKVLSTYVMEGWFIYVMSGCIYVISGCIYILCQVVSILCQVVSMLCQVVSMLWRMYLDI